MKLKVYFKPAIPVGLLAAAACLFWIAFVMLGDGVVALAVLVLALFYTALAAMSILALCALRYSSGGRIGRGRRGCSSSPRMRTIA